MRKNTCLKRIYTYIQVYINSAIILHKVKSMAAPYLK